MPPAAAGPVVRDHRGESAESGPAAAPGGVIVRDHRGDSTEGGSAAASGGVVVRDHRGETAEGGAAAASGGVIVRDHRGEGGTTVTQSGGKSKGDDGIIGGIKDLGNALEDVGRAAAGVLPPMATAGPPHTSTRSQD